MKCIHIEVAQVNIQKHINARWNFLLLADHLLLRFQAMTRLVAQAALGGEWAELSCRIIVE